MWHPAGTIGNATRERYNVLLKKQIDPHIGGIVLQRLSTADVETWHAKLRTAGLAPRTVAMPTAFSARRYTTASGMAC